MVLSQTLQAVHDVHGVITDMLRVGRIGIVSFPNLAYHKLRRMLAEEGRAPRGYGWLRDHGTTRRHPLPFDRRFRGVLPGKTVHIHRRIALDTEAGIEVFDDPNRNADLAIFVISR